MDFEAMLRGYVECALWATGDSLEGEYSVADFAPEALAKMRSDCEAFVAADTDDVRAYIDEMEAGDLSYLGHDFWLTRNGHGTGFWDRGLGLLGERLTMRAKSFGDVHLYVGDDGKVYAAFGELRCA